ncbi:phosphonate C-P lyase system protein PhnH [Sodalis sp. RH21]|uniref:phosphonate C-P lyase system protein PhnH n=1 Tax=unclassified Sodalis (in: enterobacteria) TaxID=2636512 RepID=UPI0039B5EDA3
MELLAGFTQPIHQSQQAFRLILKALGEPGVRVTLADVPGWGAIGPAATSVLLTLADGATPVWLSPALGEQTVMDNLRFHTGAPVAERLDAAAFALFDTLPGAAQLAALSSGSETSPEFSATAVVQVASLSEGAALYLSGPGIETRRRISPVLPAAVRNYLLNRPRRFPLGIDFLLVCGEGLMAVPRATHVEEC